jgi:hypothetical protein
MRNQPINPAFCLHRLCRGWPTAKGLSPTSFSLLLKRRSQRVTELISTASSPCTLLRRLWISIGPDPSAVSHSLPSIYIHNIRHCSATVLRTRYWLQHRWLDGARQCRNQVGTERNSTQRHI